jgi:N-acetylglucosamine-6-phosphate deacetylase
MQTIIFTNAKLFDGSRIYDNVGIHLEDGKLVQLIDPDDYSLYPHAISVPDWIFSVPLLDLQIYGAGEVLFAEDPSPEALAHITQSIIQTGTSGFLITLPTNELAVFEKAIDTVRDHPHPAVLGLHLEGPYINPIKKGAHLESAIKTPTVAEVQSLLDRAQGVIKMMTLAPECCDPEVIALLHENGVLVSAGHSNATIEEAKKGFDQGVRAVTHLFNAMSPLHHREPGLAGALFQDTRIFAGIIPDRIHVHISMIEMSARLLPDRLFLITDAVTTSKGITPHLFKGDHYALPNGTLSGSSISLLEGVQNCVAHTSLTLEEALRMATIIPAKGLKLADTYSIQIGETANLSIFNQKLKPVGTIIKGVPYFRDRDLLAGFCSDIG